ncbi:MAG: peptide chain release factor 2 [Lentisphaerae bacterium]|nr:peptide chain release factor 2 [Lentisphaerota bacterium]
MTHEELLKKVDEAKRRLEHLRGFLDVATTREKMAMLEAKMGRPDFWDRPEQAQQAVSELSKVKGIIEPFDRMAARIGDFEVLAELAELEGDDSALYDEADETWDHLVEDLNNLELMSFLTGEMDRKNAIVTIIPGAGGTEACDWCSILYRMYTHWFDKRGWKYETVDIMPGEEAGLKYVTMTVEGEYAYGYLKGEKGVHRLVRISPFDANKRRHTSFTSVDVLPEIDDDIVVDIAESDLRIDTFRASGAGGQHVNRTDSAVRITHLPTNIVVTCQSERSQHKNKANAMRILKARLYEQEEEKRASEIAAESSAKGDNAWGNQIRSYVVQPYQMVKDLRTHAETSNIGAVLDGDLDMFAEAYLRTGGGQAVDADDLE